MQSLTPDPAIGDRVVAPAAAAAPGRCEDSGRALPAKPAARCGPTRGAFKRSFWGHKISRKSRKTRIKMNVYDQLINSIGISVGIHWI